MSNQSIGKKSNSFDEQQNQFHRSTLSNKKPIPNNSSLTDNVQDLSVSKLPKDGEEAENDVVAKIYSTSNVSLHQIYEEICRAPLAKRLTLLQFKKIINEIEGERKVNSELSSQLFRAIDTTHKGSVFLSELIHFYLAHESDMSIM